MRHLVLLAVLLASEVPARAVDELGWLPADTASVTGAPQDRVPLLSWLATQAVSDLAIGTEDLRSLYDRFHGPNAVDDEMSA